MYQARRRNITVKRDKNNPFTKSKTTQMQVDMAKNLDIVNHASEVTEESNNKPPWKLVEVQKTTRVKGYKMNKNEQSSSKVAPNSPFVNRWP